MDEICIFRRDAFRICWLMTKVGEYAKNVISSLQHKDAPYEDVFDDLHEMREYVDIVLELAEEMQEIEMPKAEHQLEE